MVESAVIAGGMLPKLEACGQALKKAWAGCEFCQLRRRKFCRSFISPSWMAERR